MRRIRIGFALLAIALLVPGVLLVRRALESVAAERAAQHRSIAERVFDEMESSLGDFLRMEEERPVDHYRFYRADDSERSPLSRAPDAPFVVGYFQIDPDGRVHSPLVPRNERAARERGDLPDAESQKAAERVISFVAQFWTEPEAPAEEAPRKDVPRVARAKAEASAPKPKLASDSEPAPGTTLELDAKSGKSAGAKGEAKKEAYGVLSSLNRAVSKRDRAQQTYELEQAPAQRLARAPEPTPGADAPARSDAMRVPTATDSSSEVRFEPRAPTGFSAGGAASEAFSSSAPSPMAEASAPLESEVVREMDDAAAPRTVDELQQGDIAEGRGLGSAAAPLSAVGEDLADARADADAAASADPNVEEQVARQLASGSEARAQGRFDAQRGNAVAGLRDRLVAPAEAPPPVPAPQARAASPPARARAGLPETVRVTVDPLLGRVLDDSHLVLVRTVLVGSEGVRQGLVVDLESLGAFLRGETLSGAPWAGTEAVFRARDAERSEILATAADAYRYRHRFAEPFDALSVDLALAPLDTATSANSIYLLSVMLFASAALGLLALYRMTAVALRFSERRSNFVSAVSHELKTPLTAIRMYGEMLRDGLVPGEAKQQEYYETITSESERLSRLINNVLEFSRIERGNREMSWRVGPLGPVVEDAVQRLRPHVEREGFSLVVDCDDALPPVRYDPDAVLQVLFNLVDNALKYARESSRRELCLSCHATDAGVELCVRDHGPGVARQHLGHLFEPFYRGESELTRRHKGTGIGLALVKGLVDQMGAAIDARNAPGGGFEAAITFAPSAGS